MAQSKNNVTCKEKVVFVSFELVILSCLRNYFALTHSSCGPGCAGEGKSYH